jgi:hypothetical protein
VAAVVPAQLVNQVLKTPMVVLEKHTQSQTVQLQFSMLVVAEVLDLVVVQQQVMAAKVAAAEVVMVLLELLPQLLELLTEVAAEVVVTHKAVKAVKVS